MDGSWLDQRLFVTSVRRPEVFVTNLDPLNSIVALLGSMMLSDDTLQKKTPQNTRLARLFLIHQIHSTSQSRSTIITRSCIETLSYLRGNGLKSANWLTPGHVSSVGVPNNLKIRFS